MGRNECCVSWLSWLVHGNLIQDKRKHDRQFAGGRSCHGRQNGFSAQQQQLRSSSSEAQIFINSSSGVSGKQAHYQGLVVIEEFVQRDYNNHHQIHPTFVCFLHLLFLLDTCLVRVFLESCSRPDDYISDFGAASVDEC